MEGTVLQMALERDLPVLGICRGIQFINAYLGGSLYQDLPSQHPSEVEHHQSPPYDVPAHAVALVEGSPLRRCLGVERLPVNSYHHQAVRRLAPGLEAMACAPDGLIEAAYMPGKRFLWTVQWHPEFSYKTDEYSRRIFQALIDSMT
jgi:putative glutamine amidotransferase